MEDITLQKANEIKKELDSVNSQIRIINLALNKVEDSRYPGNYFIITGDLSVYSRGSGNAGMIELTEEEKTISISIARVRLELKKKDLEKEFDSL